MQIACKIAFFLALIGLTGCSPQKRLSRLVAKQPELLTADTLRFKKNIVVPAKVVVQPHRRWWWWVVEAGVMAVVVWLVLAGRRKNE